VIGNKRTNQKLNYIEKIYSLRAMRTAYYLPKIKSK
jgi:hypothetical protein